MPIEFDPRKNKLNLRAHGVSLADVESAFFDPMAITIEDHDHHELRLVTLGADALGRLLVVCYTWKDEGTIRVISARKAQPHERRAYEEK